MKGRGEERVRCDHLQQGEGVRRGVDVATYSRGRGEERVRQR